MRILICLAVGVVCFGAAAQNCFEVGAKWESTMWGTQYPEPTVSSVSVSIDGYLDGMGVDAMQMTAVYEGDIPYEKSFIIHPASDQVYFTPPETSNLKWYLMYDFSMREGEGAYVYNPLDYARDLESNKTYVKCIAVRECDPEFSGWDVMEMEEYDSDACAVKLGKGIWLKGLGSIKGVLENNRFETDGASSTLSRVTLNGNVVYDAGTSEVNYVLSGEGKMSVTVNGLELHIKNKGMSEPVSIYSAEGILINTLDVSAGDCRVSLPSSGVYIVRAKDCVEKLSVRQ